MAKSPKRYSQKMYLFSIYGLFILTLLCIFFTFTYTHYKNNTIAEAKKDSENLCVSLSNAVTTQLDNMSTISMNIVYSNAIKNNFKEFSYMYRQTGTNSEALIASREKVTAINEIVTAIIGAYQSASEIKLYTMDGSCVEAGYWMRTSNVNLESIEWYEEVMNLNGHKYFTEPSYHQDLPSTEGSSNPKFISLVRMFLDSAGKPEGIVEVVQDCNTIFSLASQIEQSNPGTTVTIYNSRKEMVYPYTTPREEDYYSEIQHSGLKPNNGELITTGNNNSVLLTYESLSEYGWTVIVTKEQEAVYLPLHNYRNMVFLIGGVSIILTMLICFFISQRLTKPLEKLTKATGKITINRVLSEEKVNLTSADSNIRELSILCDSIRNMYEKLRSTSQEVLLSRSEETRAKLQATQSLINPHFLYNSLTNISIMAEEEMNEDIVKICGALCDYFRYITSGQEMIVPLEEEIFYTERYLKCMKFRFGDEFEYKTSIAQETESFLIPKLLIQPIVENAFKYAFCVSPPWRLMIRSYVKNETWFLEIEDNGGTMNNEKKKELIHLYENLNMNEELKSMEIGGMGLKNVYLRLKLLYGENAIFKITNDYPGRTIFIVGGPIYHSREEYYHEHPKL